MCKKTCRRRSSALSNQNRPRCFKGGTYLAMALAAPWKKSCWVCVCITARKQKSITVMLTSGISSSDTTLIDTTVKENVKVCFCILSQKVFSMHIGHRCFYVFCDEQDVWAFTAGNLLSWSFSLHCWWCRQFFPVTKNNSALCRYIFSNSEHEQNFPLFLWAKLLKNWCTSQGSSIFDTEEESLTMQFLVDLHGGFGKGKCYGN